jgi:hypothetical protein
VDPLDALQVINRLNAAGPGPLSLPDVPDELQPPFLDTDGDGQVLPHDVLLVINNLNDTVVPAEGELIAGIDDALSVIWPERPITGSLAADATDKAISLGLAADRGDARRADLPLPALRSSSPERALGDTAVRRPALRRAELEAPSEDSLGWWGLDCLLG